MNSSLHTSLGTDHTRTVITEKLRRAEADRLVRELRRTTLAAAVPANREPASWLARWGRRVRLQPAG